MGNTQTIEENEVIKNRNGEWKTLTEGYGCTVVEAQSGLRAQEYKIPLDQKSWELNNIKIYEFRRVQNSHLVKVHNIQADESNQILSVRTELIPHRLAEIIGLTPDESLYVALYSLIGFRYVYELCQRRLFSINDSMIGFTPQGNVRVWINSNFAVNQLDVNAFKANPVKTETDLVNLILNAVAKHSLGGQLPERFMAHYNSKASRSITDTLRCFKAFLQSQNVAISNRVEVTGKLAGNAQPTHGYYQKLQITNQQYLSQTNQTNQMNQINQGTKISQQFQNINPPKQQPMGKLYTDGIASDTHKIPILHQKPTPFQTNLSQQSQTQTSTFIQRNTGHQKLSSQVVGEARGIHPNPHLSRNIYNQNHQNQYLQFDPRLGRTSTLGFAPRGHAQSQIYTRQGTNNFPLPSQSVNNVNLQRGYHNQFNSYHQPQYRRTPVAQAQLAPAIGTMTKVIGVTKFSPLIIQQGKVNEVELKTQKQIHEAMNPNLNLNNTYMNPQTNKAAKFIELSNLQQIKKTRAPTSEDYVSGQNRNLSFVNPDVQKMMMFTKQPAEQVHFNSPLNNIGNPYESNVTESIYHPTQGNNMIHHNQKATQINHQNRNYSQPPQNIKRSHASHLSSQNKSQYSSLSKRSNRSFKADKIVLMNGKAVRSNPIQITQINSNTPVQRTQTTIYHEMSSFGLQPTIKQQSSYSYNSPSISAPQLSIPKSPYRQLNTNYEIIQEHYEHNIRYN